MTTAPVPAQAGTHGRKRTIAEILADIHLRATNLAEVGLRRDSELVTELDIHGWTLTAAVTAAGQPVMAGYPKITLAKGDKQRIEIHFPTVNANDCNLIRNDRQIVVRQGKIENDTGGSAAQPVDDLLANILTLLPRTS